MSKNLPLKIGHAKGQRIANALADAALESMRALWVSEGGVRGEIDEGVFRAECGFVLRRLGDAELDRAFPPHVDEPAVVPMPDEEPEAPDAWAEATPIEDLEDP